MYEFFDIRFGELGVILPEHALILSFSRWSQQLIKHVFLQILSIISLTSVSMINRPAFLKFVLSFLLEEGE